MIEAIQSLYNQRGFLLIRIHSVDCVENPIHHDAEPGKSCESGNTVNGGFLDCYGGGVPNRDPLLKLFKPICEGYWHKRICFLQSRWSTKDEGLQFINDWPIVSQRHVEEVIQWGEMIQKALQNSLL